MEHRHNIVYYSVLVSLVGGSFPLEEEEAGCWGEWGAGCWGEREAAGWGERGVGGICFRAAARPMPLGGALAVGQQDSKLGDY